MCKLIVWTVLDTQKVAMDEPHSGPKRQKKYGAQFRAAKKQQALVATADLATYQALEQTLLSGTVSERKDPKISYDELEVELRAFRRQHTYSTTSEAAAIMSESPDKLDVYPQIQHLHWTCCCASQWRQRRLNGHSASCGASRPGSVAQWDRNACLTSSCVTCTCTY